jgi:Transglutaminase-like superfamily
MARRPPDLPTLRAAAWAAHGLWQARRTLRRDGMTGARVGAPPPLPRSAGRGVHAVLRRSPASCLERALVLQRWEAAHGAPAAVVIGVQGPARGFRAHAWLEGRADRLAGTYEELVRLPPDFR